MAAISIRELKKIYSNGFTALDGINLEVQPGEIFALLGPNGAGKTTLISAVCGIVKATAGSIEVFGHDNVKDYRAARSRIGLVPQELTTDAFESVWNTVSFSRGLFGKSKNSSYIKETLRKLSLWDKKDSQIRMLSGGMKRRVMIAKALSHEPDIMFLDEPTAGVDVKLRKSMWAQMSELRETGVTIILTTHYIEEAEAIADRIGIINEGKLIITEEKVALMKKLGKKELIITLYEPLVEIPKSLSEFNVQLAEERKQLVFSYDPTKEDNEVANLLDCLKENAIRYKDLGTRQNSLEEIFIQLVDKS
jgi:ABC-2 type transport system ATP-binding protein